MNQKSTGNFTKFLRVQRGKAEKKGVPLGGQVIFCVWDPFLSPKTTFFANFFFCWRIRVRSLWCEVSPHQQPCATAGPRSLAAARRFGLFTCAGPREPPVHAQAPRSHAAETHPSRASAGEFGGMRAEGYFMTAQRGTSGFRPCGRAGQPPNIEHFRAEIAPHGSEAESQGGETAKNEHSARHKL